MLIDYPFTTAKTSSLQDADSHRVFDDRSDNSEDDMLGAIRACKNKGPAPQRPAATGTSGPTNGGLAVEGLPLDLQGLLSHIDPSTQPANGTTEIQPLPIIRRSQFHGLRSNKSPRTRLWSPAKDRPPSSTSQGSRMTRVQLLGVRGRSASLRRRRMGWSVNQGRSPRHTMRFGGKRGA